MGQGSFSAKCTAQLLHGVVSLPDATSCDEGI